MQLVQIFVVTINELLEDRLSIILNDRNMKRLITTIFILALIYISSCKVVDKYTQFDIPYSTEVSIPPTLGINLPFNIFTPDIETNSESTFEINDTRKDLIEEVSLTSISMDVKTPDDGDFSFLKSVIIYLSAEGLPEIEIARNDNIPNDVGNQLNLTPTNVDFQEYIKKDQINLRVNTVTDQILMTEYKLGINCVFHVDAKILGI